LSILFLILTSSSLLADISQPVVTVSPNQTNASAVLPNSSTRAVRITVPNAVVINDYGRVRFLVAAGIENPSIYGSYNLSVHTSSQPLEGILAAYTLQPTTTVISNFTVTITPLIANMIGHYTWNFTTGSPGRLVSGVSTIFLLIPDDATFTLGVPTNSKVAVNSTAANAPVLRTGTLTNPDTLIITVPSSVTIGNNTNVTVVIDETAGLRNAISIAALTYAAYTSVENGVVGYDLSLPVSLTAFTAENNNS
jgi:hypothetical protein